MPVSMQFNANSIHSSPGAPRGSLVCSPNALLCAALHESRRRRATAGGLHSELWALGTIDRPSGAHAAAD
eukprot:3118840-Prymnesium_polylepis.1